MTGAGAKANPTDATTDGRTTQHREQEDMPRIRSIKPEFWTDGAMIALPFEARLFYIGSWNFACDRGHLPDDPFGLKLKVLPADPVDGATLVQQLVESGRMERITLPDGRGFLGIPRFTDHQRIDTRWNSRCPVCAVIDSGELTETHASYDETHGDSHKLMLEGRGGEGKGVGGETANAELSPFCPNHPNGTEKPCRACQNARLKYQAAQTSAKNKPTPTPRRAKECDLHPGYPLPCDRCARDAADAS